MILPDGKNTNQSVGIFKVSQNGLYTVKAYDKLGNETIKNIQINNIGFKVVFKDYDGKIINSQIVLSGNGATKPDNPGAGESTKPIMALVFSALSLAGIKKCKSKK